MEEKGPAPHILTWGLLCNPRDIKAGKFLSSYPHSSFYKENQRHANRGRSLSLCSHGRDGGWGAGPPPCLLLFP